MVPLTINGCEYDNTYVCSPYTAFVSYAKAEMCLLEDKLLRLSLATLVDALGALLKSARINEMVQVNNWMFSTNLYLQGWHPNVRKITDLMAEQFPQHYLCFRSLNRWSNSALIDDLSNAGYSLIASRQVYVYDNLNGNWLPHKNVQHDLRLLRRTNYSVVENSEIEDSDYDRIAELYDILYRRKYPHFNPAFTAAFMRLSHSIGLLKFVGLKNGDGVLDGVVGMLTVDGTTSAPIVGYDTSLDQRLGLYRLLMTLIFQEAYKSGLNVNLSSGAASFKRLRGGRPEIEYSAVYARHLSVHRQAAIAALILPINRIGIPLLQKLKL
jgi:hypothetical protein